MACRMTSNTCLLSFSTPPIKSNKGRTSSPAKVSMVDTVTQVKTVEKLLSAIHKKNKPVTQSMPREKREIFDNLEPWMRENILPFLKPVEKCWQPQDFLPEPSTEGFYDQVQEIRLRAKELPDEYFVCLVGDMVTEEALPTYQTLINNSDGIRDLTNCSPTGWAIWTRGWTAEENRHGDLLNKYLYLSGRVDMKMIEKTVQYLIGFGMNVMVENNPYKGFLYTSFQERATFISHGNTASLAKKYGDVNLAQICGTIASDEKRHENAYSKIVEKLFEVDPDYTILAFADMMQKRIVMPAHLMYDGCDNNLFEHFSLVAQRTGIYTAKDYADVLEFLVARWKVANLTGLSSEGKKAQEYLCTLGPRIRRLEDWSQNHVYREKETIPFSWIYGREVQL
ncbi:hypothetical protein LUZ63_003865 [Rhynchospora breviuscula]|uniref:Acyl-[acyl-carrier-protein] desaturase n=1 Tax=Rhynchospora breviuscula TaxID=2022672 RepID=A0A9Q0D1D8_9POAL|nr:hypothetical protein LUZ63_003865 [Rhynchospora breviuscula]